jgi:hypothetical protein
MRPFTLVYVREYDWLHTADQLRDQRRRDLAEQLAFDPECEPIPRVKCSGTRTRLRDLWSNRLSRTSRPMETGSS